LWRYTDLAATPLQDCPAGGRLNMVIVHEQYASTHHWPYHPLDKLSRRMDEGQVKTVARACVFSAVMSGADYRAGI
jgi:hypothetical protein